MQKTHKDGEFVDINADGYLDFVGFTTGDPGHVWVKEGYDIKGKLIPRGETDILLINNNGENFSHFKIPEIARMIGTMEVTADLNNDGFIDIVPLSEGEREKTAPIINNQGTNFSMSKYEYSKEISYYVTSDVDSADFNNDGFDDLVFTTTNLKPRTPKKIMLLAH